MANFAGYLPTRCMSLPAHAPEESPAIDVFGAREHNLKNIDLSIPRNQLVVITGISGSGKSSLAFDTIYACLLYTSPSPRD